MPPAFVYVAIKLSTCTNMIVYWSFTGKANRFAACLTVLVVDFSSLRQPAGYLMLVFAVLMIYKNNKILVIIYNHWPALVECSFGDRKQEIIINVGLMATTVISDRMWTRAHHHVSVSKTQPYSTIL